MQAEIEVLRKQGNNDPVKFVDSTRARKEPRPQDSAEHNVPEGLYTTTKDRTNPV